jgi:long-chain acyl-CoA synthetase
MNGVVMARLIEHASEWPHRTALVAGNVRISYKELLNRVFDMSDFLKQTRQDTIGISLENSIDWVIVDLAAMWSGVVCVPLPGFFSDQQLSHVINTAGVTLVFCSDTDRFSRLGLKFSSCRTIEGISTLFLAASQTDRPRLIGCGKMTFTSGTTGQPKGVCLPQTVIDNICLALVRRLGHLPSRNHLCVLPLSTLLENIAGLYVPLILGRTVLIQTALELGFTGSSSLDVRQFVGALNRFQPDSMILLPQLLAGLVQAQRAGLKLDYTPVFIALGGGKTSPDLINRAREQGLPVYEGYGLSECASVVSLNTPGQDRTGSVGKPLDHIEIKIENGEILVRGNNHAGYLDGGLVTEDWLHTGDLGHLDTDGFLFVTGRCKDLIISSFGRNISPEWVESEVLADPLFRQCLLFGEARAWCGAIIVTANEHIDSNQIWQHLEAINLRLPDYARIKCWINAIEPFSTVNGLLTSNGRPRRPQILSDYREQINTLYSTDQEV